MWIVCAELTFPVCFLFVLETLRGEGSSSLNFIKATLLLNLNSKFQFILISMTMATAPNHPATHDGRVSESWQWQCLATHYTTESPPAFDTLSRVTLQVITW